MTKLGDDMAPLISVTDKLRPSVDRNPHRLEAFDKQAFVFVLREDAQIGVRGQADADLLEVYARLAFAARPKIDCGNFTRSCDNGVGEIELPVKLERAGLNGERARGRARLGGLVHDSRPHPELGQPQGEDKPGRTGADHQNVTSFHLRLLNSGATKSKSGATKSKRGATKSKAGRNKNQASRNKIQTRIQAPFLPPIPAFQWVTPAGAGVSSAGTPEAGAGLADIKHDTHDF